MYEHLPQFAGDDCRATNIPRNLQETIVGLRTSPAVCRRYSVGLRTSPAICRRYFVGLRTFPAICRRYSVGLRPSYASCGEITVGRRPFYASCGRSWRGYGRLPQAAERGKRRPGLHFYYTGESPIRAMRESELRGESRISFGLWRIFQ